MTKFIFPTAMACILALSVPFSSSAQTKEKEPVKSSTQAKPVEPCKAPTNLKVTPREKGFTAEWDAVAGAKGYEVAIHDVDGKHSVNSYPSKTNTFTIATLAPGSHYEVHVVTKGCATSPHLSAASNKASVMTPGTAATKTTKAATPSKAPTQPKPTKDPATKQ